MTLPRLLIIGAMKAGTTTLYEDLGRLDGIFMSPEKEPDDLIDPEVESAEGLARYEAKFAGCPEGSIAGEASTAYTKRPTHDGVAERAKRVLGGEVRIVYVTRDPIARIVSHYHHLWGMELEQRSLNEAVLEDETYAAYSRYHWQVQPWLEEFGADKVMVLRFEDYVADRLSQLARIAEFLGVSAVDRPDETHRNASSGKRFVRRNSLMQRVAHSDFYLRSVKPLLPTTTRDLLKTLLLPRARAMKETLEDATKQELVRRLASDDLARSYFGAPSKANS